MGANAIYDVDQGGFLQVFFKLWTAQCFFWQARSQ